MSNAQETVTGNDSATRTRPPNDPGAFGWLLPIGFGVVAVGLLLMSKDPGIPVEPAAVVNPVDLAVGPRRTAMIDPPHMMVEGLAQNCNGCHQIFESSSPAGATLSFHREIDLNHGLNNRCVNCHDPHDRESLTLRDGTRIPFVQTPQLCAQCHGTVFRDWERGTHGKTLGSWITNSHDQRRLTCNECHDPHSPRYEPYTPMPGPRTLRMGSGKGDATPHHEAENESPLQRWLRDPHHGHATTTGGHP